MHFLFYGQDKPIYVKSALRNQPVDLMKFYPVFEVLSLMLAECRFWSKCVIDFKLSVHSKRFSRNQLFINLFLTVV